MVFLMVEQAGLVFRGAFMPCTTGGTIVVWQQRSGRLERFAGA